MTELCDRQWKLKEDNKKVGDAIHDEAFKGSRWEKAKR